MRVILGLTAVAALVAGAFASGGRSAASADCSKVEATAIVKRLHLGYSEFLPSPVYQVICGAFMGPGSQTMVALLASGGASNPFGGWAVFRVVGGKWQLVMERVGGGRISAAGPDIRETVSVMREGDSHCCPSGGTKARLWRWNGTRFTAGPWKQVTPGRVAKESALVFSPLPAGISCQMTDDGSVRGSWVYCWIGPSERRATVHVKMGLDGRLDVSSTIPDTLGKGGPTTKYGAQIAVGRFRCLSLRSGFKCTVIRSGKGFLFNETGATTVGP